MLQLTTGEKVFEIRQIYKKGRPFDEETATKLPVGTQIYIPVERQYGPILIAKVNGEEMRYLALIEG